MIRIRTIAQDGDTKTRLDGRKVGFRSRLEIPFRDLVNPDAGGPAHPERDGSQVGVGGDGRHRIVDEFGAGPSLLVGQEHLPLGEALGSDVVYAPCILLRVECKELVDVARICIWKECGLPRYLCSFGKEHGARPQRVGCLRDGHPLFVQRAVEEAGQHVEKRARGFACVARDEQRAAVVGELQGVPHGPRERAMGRLGGIGSDGDHLDAELVAGDHDEAVGRYRDRLGLVHQRNGPPLLDLAVLLAVDLVQVDLRGARQHRQQEAVLGDVDGHGLALDLQGAGPQARQLGGLDQPDIGRRVDGDEVALARDIKVEGIGQGRRRGRVGDELEDGECGVGVRRRRGGTGEASWVVVGHGRRAGGRVGRHGARRRDVRVAGRRGRQVRVDLLFVLVRTQRAGARASVERPRLFAAAVMASRGFSLAVGADGERKSFVLGSSSPHHLLGLRARGDGGAWAIQGGGGEGLWSISGMRLRTISATLHTRGYRYRGRRQQKTSPRDGDGVQSEAGRLRGRR